MLWLFKVEGNCFKCDCDPLLNLILFLQITSGMVISTFVSAPIMYVSAWLLTFPSMDPKPLAYAIQNVSFDISIISLVSLVSRFQCKNE